VIVGGVGLVGLAGGAYLFHRADQTQAQLTAERARLSTGFGDPSRVAQLDREHSQQVLGSNVALGVGAGLLGLGVLLFVIGSSQKRNSASRATVHVIPGLGSMGMEVRF
jgi:hypothetical protein